MTNAVVSEGAQLAKYLLTVKQLDAVTQKKLDKELPLQTTERKLICFTAKVLEVFGDRYAEAIENGIKDKALKGKFRTIWTVLTQIQNGLRIGVQTYSAEQFRESENFEDTAQLMDQVVSTGVSQDEYYDRLKGYSYATLPFPQRVLTYKNPELEALAKIEAVRKRAFDQMMERLEIFQPLEDSKEAAPVSNPEEDLYVTSRYLNSGALMWEGKPVYFDELLGMWQDKNLLQRGAARERFLESLPLHSWVKEAPRAIMAFEKHRIGSFRSFLAWCSVEALQKNLGIDLSSTLKNYYYGLFIKDESVRADLCFFSASPSKFYELQVPANRPSQQAILSLQLFLFLVRTEGLKQDAHNSLLEMIVQRGVNWREPEGFAQRSYKHPAAAVESETFRRTLQWFKANKLGDPNQRVAPDDAWRLFFVYWQVAVLQKRLGIKFSPALEDYFVKVFRDNDSVRSTVCVAANDLPTLYEMPVPESPSGHIVLSFQLFFFMVRTMGAKQEWHIALLEMLMYRQTGWRLVDIPNYHLRCWDHLCAGEEEIAFAASLKLFNDLIQQVKKKAPGDNPFVDPHCWPLFFFLWQNERREHYIRLYSDLAAQFSFTFTLSSIREFCMANFNLSGPNALFLIQKHQSILEIAKSKGIILVEPERLFLLLTPPLILSEQVAQIGNAEEKVARFLEEMRPYNFPINAIFTTLLSKHIFQGRDFIFEMLKHANAIGLKNVKDPQFLEEILAEKHELLHESGQPAPENVIQRAQGITRKLQEQFQFSDTELFRLYLEITRLVTRGEEGRLEVISQAIGQLHFFCPAMRREDAYFLLRWHPPVDLAAVGGLFELRTKWSLDENQLERCLIDPDVYQEIIKAINDFVGPLATACPSDGEAELFKISCRQSIQSAFFPPLQRITEWFRIKNITTEGIYWLDDDFAANLGQVNLILRRSHLAIYSDWKVINDKPTFFISFFNLKTGAAYSENIPLKVSATVLSDQDKRKPFYSLLFALSQLLLSEESTGLGVKEEIGKYAAEITKKNLTLKDIEAMKDMLKRAKVAFRKLFLSATADRPLPLMDMKKPLDIAAHGHIFSSRARGSLLPEEAFSHIGSLSPTSFLPDATDPFIDACVNSSIFIFNPQKWRPELLNLNLRVSSITEPSCELPIMYQVENAQGLKDRNIQMSGVAPQADLSQRKKRDERALPEDQLAGSFVTLSILNGQIKRALRYPPEALGNRAVFQRYFDFHNLQLKALYYFSLKISD